MARAEFEVWLWKRDVPAPYKQVTVEGDPDKKQLGDPVSHLPEAIMFENIIWLRGRSGKYREATVHYENPPIKLRAPPAQPQITLDEALRYGGKPCGFDITEYPEPQTLWDKLKRIYWDLTG